MSWLLYLIVELVYYFGLLDRKKYLRKKIRYEFSLIRGGIVRVEDVRVVSFVVLGIFGVLFGVRVV